MLLLFMARVLPPEEVGLYGLVAVTVGYGMMLLGLDFYTYANRELLSREPDVWPTIIRDQAALYAVAYAVGLPIFLFVFHFGVLPWQVVGWFFCLLVAEHIGQELNRLLIAVGRPLLANVVLFIRSGIWSWAVIGLMLLDLDYRNLNIVFGAWVFGAVCAVFLGAGMLRQLPWKSRSQQVNWQWIRRGISVALIFLMATLCFKGLFTFDRYVVESAVGSKLLGVYTFYVTIAMAATAFMDAGVFAFLYPKVTAMYRTGKMQNFAREMRTLWRHTTVATTALVLCLLIGIKPILWLIDRPIYENHLSVYWVLLGAVALYSFGMVPHYGLYAFGRDGVIVASHAAGLIAFFAVSIVAASLWGMLGVAAGLVAGLAVVLLIKLWRYHYWRVRLVGSNVSSTSIKVA